MTFLDNVSARVLDNVANGFKKMGPTVFSGLAWGPVVQTHHHNQLKPISAPIDFLHASMYASMVAIAGYTTGEIFSTIRKKLIPKKATFLKNHFACLTAITGSIGVAGHLYARYLENKKTAHEERFDL